MRQKEERYLQYVLEAVREKLRQLACKMGDNAQDMERMNEYFWENYAEFDEYGYEMYDSRMAMKTSLTQQESYAKDRARYEKMMEAPYFGRVDFCYEDEEEPETYYIGIGNLAQERAAQPLVYDWRAPVSSLFYDYDQGPAKFEAPMGILSGEITAKRQYKIRNGQLLYILETEMNINDEILQQALSERADAKLKSIVTTIQREQNRIIRDASHRIMVVQGCAGSGKTSVALHRIAYLLYHNREALRAAQILVLSPNGIFGDYISRILPELGEEHICEMTLDDFAYRELRELGEAQDRYDEMEYILHGGESRAAYKQSREYVRELNEFILELEWEAVDILDFSYKKMKMSAEEISRFFYEKLCDVPIFSRMEKIAEYLIDEWETLHNRDMEEEERQSVKDQMRRMYRMEDPGDLYREFLRRRGGEEKAEEGSRTILYEDVYPLLYLKYQTREVPLRRRVRHLVVDEMQDYSYLQYLILKRLFDCSMTILGDRQQTLDGGVRNVMEFLPEIFGRDIHYVEMKKSYRSTREIAEYAAGILGQEDVQSVERHGENPRIQRFSDREQMMDAIAEQLKEQREMRTMAVLCLGQEEADAMQEQLEKRGVAARLLQKDSMEFSTGISVMPYYLAKGLEFDAVFVPDLQTYVGETYRQALYINATRALHILRMFAVEDEENQRGTGEKSSGNDG